jgi:hypothetical protein
VTIRVIRVSKISVLSKLFGNFVPNFREQVANSNNYKLKTKQKGMTPMNTQMKTSTTTPPPCRRPPNQPNATKVRQNMKTRSVTILATIIAALVAFTSASDALAQGDTWTATGSLNTGRRWHTASLLPNGMVLVAGGFGNGGFLTSAELYDPASGTWTATGSLNTARWGHKATLLPNGTVLVAGGLGNSGLLTSAELYAATAPSYSAQVQQPINADGSSVFSVRRGVVPAKFTLTQGGVATCDLPPATIAVTRTAGGTTGPIDESIYTGSADTGSNFRIDSCQYVYNLSASALGVGTYRVDILIDGQVVGSAVFALQ